MKIVAGYIRVSAVENDQAKQRREMNRWLKSNRLNPKNRPLVRRQTDQQGPASTEVGKAESRHP